jgi:hypothetical protein
VSFLSHLKQYDKKEVVDESVDVNTLVEADDSDNAVEDILRKNKYKIKEVIKTAFGVQIDLAKAYDEDEIKELLSDHSVKIKGKSIFVVY